MADEKKLPPVPSPAVVPPKVDGTPPVITAPVVPPTEVKEVDTTNLDEHGYEKVAPAPDNKDVLTPKVVTKPEDEKIDPSTGYGDKPPKVDPIETKPAEQKEIDLGYELKVDEVIPKEEVTKIKEFAKKNGISKEQAQAYFDMRKDEVKQYNETVANAQKAQQQQVQQTRATWHQELQDDPTFGGDKFSHNIQQVEKVLKDFMPGTKKILTERGSMLPPYVMRDLAKLAEHLYATEKMTQGDPSVPTVEKKEDDFLTQMYQ